MPIKSSTYTDLTLTHERLKRETQLYLDSLEIGSSPSSAGNGGNDAASPSSPAEKTARAEEGRETTKAEPEEAPSPADDFDSEFDARRRISEEGDSDGDDSGDSRTESSSSGDLPDLPPRRPSSDASRGRDDDSLFAMAARLEDSSVISYSSEVPGLAAANQYRYSRGCDNFDCDDGGFGGAGCGCDGVGDSGPRPLLALPCSAEIKYPKEGRCKKKSVLVFESKLERLKQKLEKDLGLDDIDGSERLKVGTATATATATAAARGVKGRAADVHVGKGRRRSRQSKHKEGQSQFANNAHSRMEFAAAAAEGKGRRPTSRQSNHEDNQFAGHQETTAGKRSSSTPPPPRGKRDRSKERRRGEENNRGHSSSFYEGSCGQREGEDNSFRERQNAQHARGLGMEEAAAAAGGAAGKKFCSPEKKGGPRVSQWKDSEDHHPKKSGPKISQWKDADQVQPKKNGPKISQWKEADKTPKHNHLNDSECTLQTNNTKKNKPRRFSGKKKGRKANDESDESMHGVGLNVRLPKAPATSAKDEESKRKSKSPRSRSKSNSKVEEGTHRPRSRSTPPILETKESDLSSSLKSNISDEVNSTYDSDCNTEFFYESTDDEEFYSSEEELPAVGTSVLKAVEDLNSKSIGGKVKNLLGIRGGR